MEFSDLVVQFASSNLQQLAEKKAQMLEAEQRVIDLSIGTPDLAPGPHVIQAVMTASMDPGNYRYSLLDLPRLRSAVLNWYKRRYDVKLNEDEYLSLNGTQEGFAHVFLAICNPGDLVIVGTPGYPVFSYGPLLARARLYKTPLLEENGYLVDFDSIPESVARQAKAIIVSYPSNPHGATAPASFYERLIDFARKFDVIVIHDNAYADFVHDSKPAGSFLRFPGARDVGIEFASLSKSYNLTGLRLAFAMGNRELIQAFKKVRNQIDYGLSFIDQYAAIAALEGPDDVIQNNRIRYRERRDVLCLAMREIGWNVPKTPASMFTWFPIPENTTSDEFALQLLDRAGILCVPGSIYGEGGEGYLRFALVQPREVIAEAALLIAQSGLIQQ